MCMFSHVASTRIAEFGEPITLAPFSGGSHYTGPGFRGEKKLGKHPTSGSPTDGAKCWVCVPHGHWVRFVNLPVAFQQRYVVGPNAVAQFVMKSPTVDPAMIGSGAELRSGKMSNGDAFVFPGIPADMDAPLLLTELLAAQVNVTFNYLGAEQPVSDGVEPVEVLVSVREPVTARSVNLRTGPVDLGSLVRKMPAGVIAGNVSRRAVSLTSSIIAAVALFLNMRF